MSAHFALEALPNLDLNNPFELTLVVLCAIEEHDKKNAELEDEDHERALDHAVVIN